MKTHLLPALTAVVVLELAAGCSSPAPEAGAGAEQKPSGDAYQTALPPAFSGHAIQTGGRCFIDSINGQHLVPRNEVAANGALNLDGWVLDGGNMAPPKVAVELASLTGGQSYYAPARRTNRPGLGDALKLPAADQAGLQSTASLNAVPPGLYAAKLLVGSDNATSQCDPNVVVLVK